MISIKKLEKMCFNWYVKMNFENNNKYTYYVGFDRVLAFNYLNWSVFDLHLYRWGNEVMEWFVMNKTFVLAEVCLTS